MKLSNAIILSCYPLKIGSYNFKIFYVSLMVIPREQPIVIIQKNMISQSILIPKHIKTQKKRQIRNKENESIKQPENSFKNSSSNNLSNDNYFKSNWVKLFSQ